MCETFSELSEAREFCLALRARPPLLVRGGLLLACLLLAAAVAWAWLTEADLVVRAGGRVRPSDAPTRVFYTPRGEGAATGLGGRVASVHFKPGDEVKAGDVLARRDTERLDNEIARKRRAARAAEEDLAQIALLEKAQRMQAEAAQARAKEELAQAEAEEALARKRRDADLRLARAEADGAADELRRARRAAQASAVAEQDVVKARTAHEVALARVQKAGLPVDDSKSRVARRALALLRRESELKLEELAGRRTLKSAEVDAARLELANLELERREAVLRSPVDGVVTAGELRPGDALEPGKAVMEVAGRGAFRFEALVPSDELANVRVGMPARVRLDAYDYQRYGTLAGTVCYVAPDSTTQEGKPGAFFLVRVEVDGDEVGRGELRGAVKLGMAGQVEIVTDRQSLLSIFLKKARQTISLG